MAISYKEKFKQLQHLLLGAYDTFYVWKTLQKKEYNEVYEIDGNFWSAVIPALQHEWFTGLARLYENSRYSNTGVVISVYALIKEHPNPERVKEAEQFLYKNKHVLNNITRIRDHRYAHNNVRFLVTPKEFEKRFKVRYGELEEIFEFTDKMLGILHPEDGHSYILSHMKKEAETHTEDIMFGLRYFFSERVKHKQKWIDGEVNEPNFP